VDELLRVFRKVDKISQNQLSYQEIKNCLGMKLNSQDYKDLVKLLVHEEGIPSPRLNGLVDYISFVKEVERKKIKQSL